MHTSGQSVFRKRQHAESVQAPESVPDNRIAKVFLKSVEARNGRTGKSLPGGGQSVISGLTWFVVRGRVELPGCGDATDQEKLINPLLRAA